MDIFTHFWIGVLLSILSLRFFNLGLVIYASIMATIPDFDIFLELVFLFEKA